MTPRELREAYKGWQRGDRWVVTASFARPNGLVVRRYVQTIHGSTVTFTDRQALALKFDDRRDADQTTCDVRLIDRRWHPVRLVRLTRVLEDRETVKIGIAS